MPIRKPSRHAEYWRVHRAIAADASAGVSALRVEHDTGGYALAGAELIAGAGVLVAIALEALRCCCRTATCW